VFIAREQRRPLGPLPDEAAISVMTLAELELGVLAAADPDVRALRADTLALARAADPLPVVTQDDDFTAMAGAHARLNVLQV